MTTSADPDAYPHTLDMDGDRVFLVSRRDDGDPKRVDLGNGPHVRAAYARWRHLLDDHGRNDANMFLWGFMTGMGVSAAWELERRIGRRA